MPLPLFLLLFKSMNCLGIDGIWLPYQLLANFRDVLIVLFIYKSDKWLRLIINILKHIILHRLDEQTASKWKPQLSSKEFQTLLSNLTAIKIRGTFGENGECLIFPLYHWDALLATSNIIQNKICVYLLSQQDVVIWMMSLWCQLKWVPAPLPPG